MSIEKSPWGFHRSATNFRGIHDELYVRSEPGNPFLKNLRGEFIKAPPSYNNEFGDELAKACLQVLDENKDALKINLDLAGSKHVSLTKSNGGTEVTIEASFDSATFSLFVKKQISGSDPHTATEVELDTSKCSCAVIDELKRYFNEVILAEQKEKAKVDKAVCEELTVSVYDLLEDN